MQAFWMIVASFAFATMSVFVKISSAYFNAAELVFYRGLISILVMWILSRKTNVTLKTAYPAMHAWRSIVGVTAMMAWFYSMGHLPLATAMTLNYMSSVWIAAFFVGGALLAWRPSSVEISENKARLDLPVSLILAVLTGFVGVVLMLRPTLSDNQGFAAIIGLLSGMCAAFAYLQVVALSRVGEPETRTVFYFAIGSSVAGGIGMLIAGVSPLVLPQAIWLLPIGLCASLGQWSMTRAYSSAKNQGGTLLVANLQYSGIVFAAIYGVLLFSDILMWSSWLGMVLIIVSGITATVLRNRKKPSETVIPNSPAQEH